MIFVSNIDTPQTPVIMSTATKFADVLHKSAATGLILLSVAGLANVTRGFYIMGSRHIGSNTTPTSESTTTPPNQ